MHEDEKLQQQIADIGTRYLKRTLGELAQLRACLQNARSGAPDSLKQLERLAHKIHGSGAMFGFDDLSESAAQIEQIAAAGNDDPDTLSRIEAGIEALQIRVEQQARDRGIE